MPEPRIAEGRLVPTPGAFIWDGGMRALTQAVAQPSKPLPPLDLHAYVAMQPASYLPELLRNVWLRLPHLKTTRAAWNASHLHRDPNQGRPPDSYAVERDRWEERPAHAK